jgi:hypothetical protein
MAADLIFPHISGLNHHRNANKMSIPMFFGPGNSILTSLLRLE